MKLGLTLLMVPLLAGADGRLVDAVFTLAIRDIPARAGVIQAWIPMPRTDESQVLTEYLVRGGLPAAVLPDPATGDQVLRLDVPAAQAGPETVLTVLFRVERLDGPRIQPASAAGGGRLFLARQAAPDRRAWAPAPAAEEGNDAVSRAVHRLTGPEGAAAVRGLPEADRALALHALLADDLRAAGIPARLVTGVVLSQTPAPGAAGGRRHWVEYQLSGHGWEPLDLLPETGKGGPESRVSLSVSAARPEEPHLPLVKIDGLDHPDIEAAWSGREVARDPVTVAFNTRAAGKGN